MSHISVSPAPDLSDDERRVLALLPARYDTELLFVGTRLLRGIGNDWNRQDEALAIARWLLEMDGCGMSLRHLAAAVVEAGERPT